MKISLEEYYTKAKFEETDFNLYFQLVFNKEVMAQITERAIPLDEAKNDFTRLVKRNENHQLFGCYKVYDSLWDLNVIQKMLRISPKHFLYRNNKFIP